MSAKQAVQDVLKISPEDIQLHRIHGMYTGHILDIRKTMMQEQAVDRDQLLIDQLRYFPKADHDDGPDALEMVFSLITHHTTFGPRVRSLSI